MIYFVDEDVEELEPFVFELKSRKFDVTRCENADAAYDRLRNASDIEAVILDVMLATENGATSRFEAGLSHDFVTTGLVLLDKLMVDFAARGDSAIPSRVIVFSSATRDWVVQLIYEKCKSCGIAYLDKKDYEDPYLFGEKVEELLVRWGA